MRILRLRLSVFVLISFCLLCSIGQNPIFDIFQNFDNITYFYQVSKTDIKLDGAKITNCGAECIVECSSKCAKNVKNQLGNILGESVRIKNCSSKTIVDVLVLV